MTTSNVTFFKTHSPNHSGDFEVVRRNFQSHTEVRDNGAELIFTNTGEYAIQQPPGEIWQFTPPEQWLQSQDRNSRQPIYRQDWATAEELRTRSGEGVFDAQQIETLDAVLVREHRVTSSATRLNIATEDELQQVLHDHHIPLDSWRPTAIHDLFMYIRPSDRPVVDNVTLHEAKNSLWIATAQTMLANVYYADDGLPGTTTSTTYRLQEIEKRYYDSEGILGPLARLTMRSSLGETGGLIDGIPERPTDAAKRCLREEAAADDNDIVQLISTGSLLRQKQAGHGHFKGLNTEDHTHYFDAWLRSDSVQNEGYTFDEYDADGKPRVNITLGWRPVDLDI